MSNDIARETLERTFAAPLDLVWELWTTKEGIESWHGPGGFRTDVTALELRPGGAFHYTMTATDPKTIGWMESKGRPTSWPARATFTEVTPKTRLAYDLAMPMGPDGDTVDVPHSVTLTETPDGVHLVMTLEAPSADMIRGAAGGYRASLERMAARLAG
jgi:uncharacterized protein YndB with AHSA1/START domain